MIPVDLSGKTALVTGVGDNESFAWFIAKALNAAGAKILLACHPRMLGIVESFLSRDQDAESRILPFGRGELKVEKILPMDARFDTMADVDAETRADKRLNKHGDFSIEHCINTFGKEFGHIDILIHSIAFSREITKLMLQTSRSAYFEALGISAYSLTSMLRYAEPFMTVQPGASALALTYLGGERVVPYYGGGMSTAKAALQIDAKQLAHNLGSKGIRVNLISAGPYASRAARSIRPGEFEKSIEYAAMRSPLPRGIKPEEVANATVFLCSDLASAISGHTLYVDCGYHTMAV